LAPGRGAGRFFRVVVFAWGVPGFIWNVKDLSNAEIAFLQRFGGAVKQEDFAGFRLTDSAPVRFASDPLHGVALAPQGLEVPELGFLDDLLHGGEGAPERSCPIRDAELEVRDP